jgi:hypothetical protein
VGLVGARLFFAGHQLAPRIGAVINMESRGGGGRTAMFETGRGNGAIMELYRRAVTRPSANSLAVLVYELMPNNTDFTIPKEKGIAGFNFAFIGRGELYHSPAATPDRLDRGTLQDLGAQALAVTSALAFTPSLPPKAEDAAFGDVLGLFVIAYPPVFGWAVLGAAAALFAFAWTRVRRRSALGPADVLGGAASGLAFLLHTALLLRVMNTLSGSGRGSNYYDRLAALPRLELQAYLLCLAALLLICVARPPARRALGAAPALLLTLGGLVLGGWSVILAGLGLGAAASAMLLRKEGSSVWGGWFGFAVPVALLALAAQIAAPTAAPVLAWPLLLAAAAAAAAALLDPELKRPVALIPPALLAIVGTAQLLYLGHFTFLGLGAPTPDAMALYALLVGLLVWPVVRSAAAPRLFALGALALVIAAAGVASSVRLDPMAPTIPPYSEKMASS